MSWFKVDDKLWGHPKWLATPIRARGLWVTAGSWCADQEQDGNVPRHVLPILGGTVRDASALVAAGLWTVTDTGWCFHGWAEFQPTRDQKDAERSAARERMRAARERKAAQRAGDVRPNTSEVRAEFGRSSEDVRSTPTRPDPTRSSSKEELQDGARKRAARIPDDYAPTAELLAWAGTQGFTPGQCATLTAEFVDYWRGIGGQRGTKLDWDGTWRNWVRRSDPSRIREVARPLTLVAGQPALSLDEVENLIGPDGWALPEPPPGIGQDINITEFRAWARKTRDDHLAERMSAALAKLNARTPA